MPNQEQDPFIIRLGNAPAAPTTATPTTEAPSTGRLGAAATSRVLSGILGGLVSGATLGAGSVVGGGIGAAGEYLAQALEEGKTLSDLDSLDELKAFFSDPKRAGRAAVEAGVAAVPGGALVKGGKWLSSALRSGGLAAGGETLRQVARGDEQFQPGPAIIAGLTGGAVGAAVSPFVPKIPVVGGVTKTPTAKTIDELVLQTMGDVEAFKKALPMVLQREGVYHDLAPTTLAARAEAFEAAGQPELADAVRTIGLAHGPWKPHDILVEAVTLHSQGSRDAAMKLAEAAEATRRGGTKLSNWKQSILKVEEAAKKAANDLAKKQTDAETARTLFNKAIEDLKEGKAEASKTIKADLGPGQTGTFRQKLVGEGEDDLEDATDILGKTPAKKGRGRKKAAPATTTAPENAPEVPITAASSVVSGVDPQILARQMAVRGELPTVLPTPEVNAGVVPVSQAAEAVTPSVPKAEFLGWQELPDAPPMPLYNVVDGPSAGSTVTQETLEKLGIAIPETPPVPTGRPPKPANMPAQPTKNVVPVVDEVPAPVTASEAAPIVPVSEAPQLAPRSDKSLRANMLPAEKRAADAAFQDLRNRTGNPRPAPRRPPGSGETSQPLDMSVVPAPQVDVPITAQPTPSKLAPSTVKALTGRGISKEAAEKMTPEEALAAMTTPRAQKPEIPTPPVKIPMKLTADERIAVLEKLNREMYPTELADKLSPLQTEYHRLADEMAAMGKVKKGSPEFEKFSALKDRKGRIGREMAVVVDQAEDAGLIAPGLRNQWKAKAEGLLEDANANKVADSITIGKGMDSPSSALLPEEEAAMLAEQGVVPRENVPALIDDLKAGQAAAAATEVEASPLKLSEVTEGLGAEFDNKVAEIQKALAEGRMTPEVADQQSVALAQEYLKAAAKAKGVKGDGSITLGSGLGGIQGLFEKHPEVAIKAALIAGGALTGAAMNEENPVIGALLGAGAGWSASKVGSLLKQMKVNPKDVPELRSALKNQHDRDSIVSTAWQLIPHIQRSHFLMNLHGMGANIIAGPLGSGFFGALTKAIAGDARGGEAIKLLTNPKLLVQTWKEMGEQANMLVRNASAGDPMLRAETGGDVLERTFQSIENRYGPQAERMTRGYVQGVGLWMTRGDLTVRTLLKQAGFTDDEARVMTLTSEAEGKLFKKLMNFGRAATSRDSDYDKFLSTFGSLMFPFVRTPVNIFEQGIQRLPGAGIMVQGMRGVEAKEIIAQQAVSSVLAFGSYLIGLNTDEDTARTMRRYVSNLGGQYSLITNLGFAIGQGSRSMGQAKPSLKSVLSPATVRQFSFSVPVPEASFIENWGNFLVNPDEAPLPRGLFPFQQEFTTGLNEINPPAPKQQEFSVPRLQFDMTY
ncbi:MAG: hypothetical protein AB7J46_06450 [Candidatus Altimarinota bacterium]